ncbi:MAG: hypothetical protein R3F07_19685 [Opitutaceae bacterium]
MRIITVLSIFVFTAVAHGEDEVLTREQLFAPGNDPNLNPEKRYAEFDLDGDGTNDLLLSTSVSQGGTGGLIYNLYLGVGHERFKQLDQFLAGGFALEDDGKTKRLWSYTHRSSQSGTIQYRYFDRKGTFQKSQPLLIYPGDGGSEVGNGIYRSIFNEKTMLRTKATKDSNKTPEVTTANAAAPQL